MTPHLRGSERQTAVRTLRRLGSALLLAGAAGLLMLSGFGCKGVSKEVAQKSQPVNLKYWTVYDDEQSVQPIIAAYRALHPNISIEYRRLRYDEYKDAILNGLAEDQGPDIFSVQNSWVHEWQPRLVPVPGVMTLPFREIQGTIKKEAVTVLHQVPGITLKQLANDYVDVVSDDVVVPTEQSDPRAPLIPMIYGLPLSMDTMVMYYNRDLLNAAGIAEPPAHWKEFQDDVKKITKLDTTGAIIQSAAALGTTANVERSVDILALLMMQNGTNMTAQDGTAAFDRYTAETAGQPLPPGAVALVFYNDFANPEKEVYTWNDKMPDSLQAFAAGKTAFFFGYSYHLAMIRDLNPKLNFGISAFPQIEGNKPVNYANYWVNVVSKKTKNPDEAWGFVQFMSAADQAQRDLSSSRMPTALRSLINGQLEDEDLSVFASEAPTAKSWYHGVDANAAETAFSDMITQMISGESDPKKIVELGATKVNQTIK